MSRQPPLPPGPPPRYPPETDSYRPGMNTNQYPSHNGYPPPPGTERRNGGYNFQYGGGNQSRPRPDSYRGDQSRRHDTREPDRSMQSSYRPPQGEFTFRRDAPESIIENSNRGVEYRPRPARDQDRASDRRGGYNQRDNRQAPSRGRGGYRGRGGFAYKAVERPILLSNREPTPELMQGMNNENGAAVRYISADDSSGGEAEMDLSSEKEEDSEQPRKKQARTISSRAADGDSVPRWSNPDPYTALPPPDESLRKNKDLVAFIQKSKVVSSAVDTPKPQTTADDFISFDFGDEDKGDESISGQQSGESRPASDEGNGVPGAPSGPRGPTSGQPKSSTSFSHRDSHQQRMAADAGPSHTLQKAVQVRQELEKSSDPSLGTRKRTFDDQVKYPREDHTFTGQARQRKTQVRQFSNGKKPPVAGDVTSEWQFRGSSQTTSTPWCDGADHSRSPNMGFWLHKEINDFYEHFKPTEYEHQIRTRLVDKLRNAVKGFFGKGTDVQSFGSFPAGLYLPTADMDVVVLSESFVKNNWVKFHKGTLQQFKRFIETHHLAQDDVVEVISSAKVPLVKYVDAETGLKVDVSFENMTGVVAIETFQTWKRKYPAMPIIVTLVKQFLAMRGLNEPVNGGIGGFTVTCLVTSLLQNLPSVQSGNMVAEQNLNEILLEFFNLYGKEFNTKKTAIRFDPPGYFPKNQSNLPYSAKNLGRFSIIDPNNPQNDIAGGSSNTETIVECFSRAYDDLVRRMGHLNYSDLNERRYQSILEVIIGGDYSSFKEQREHLAHMHDSLYGSDR